MESEVSLALERGHSAGYETGLQEGLSTGRAEGKHEGSQALAVAVASGREQANTEEAASAELLANARQQAGPPLPRPL